MEGFQVLAFVLVCGLDSRFASCTLSCDNTGLHIEGRVHNPERVAARTE